MHWFSGAQVGVRVSDFIGQDAERGSVGSEAPLLNQKKPELKRSPSSLRGRAIEARALSDAIVLFYFEVGIKLRSVLQVLRLFTSILQT